MTRPYNNCPCCGVKLDAYAYKIFDKPVIVADLSYHHNLTHPRKKTYIKDKNGTDNVLRCDECNANWFKNGKIIRFGKRILLPIDIADV